ncbi:MAG TPA: ABC transporter ATP-binding protein [Anaerolineae bacterium]|nr:ABC transporter ATP-binding protein [Anaerolineae bacterium]
MQLELENIWKSFDGQPVLRGISLDVVGGEVLVLLGPSGCGKTTLLRIIAGLEALDNGRIRTNDQDITQLAPYKRNFGFVFQDYALFPHKNVAQNVAFGLRMHHWDKPRLDQRVAEVLSLVGLAGYGARPIHELSGGEQQRVALARSLAPAPRLLLLDEPLGALDRALRERLMLELRGILKQAGGLLGRPEGMTAVYVTHDQAEAFAIADKVAVMRDGRVEQTGPPHDLYRQPRTLFVARFLGMANILSGTAISMSPCIVRTEIGELEIGGGKLAQFPVANPSASSGQVPQSLNILIRPEAARFNGNEINELHGRLQDISFRGRYQIITVVVGDEAQPVTLKFELETAVSLPPTQSPIRLSLDPSAIQLLESGEQLGKAVESGGDTAV